MLVNSNEPANSAKKGTSLTSYTHSFMALSYLLAVAGETNIPQYIVNNSRGRGTVTCFVILQARWLGLARARGI